LPLTERRPAVPSPRILTVIVLCAAVAGCGAPTLVATPNLYADSDEDPFAGVAPVHRTPRTTILYATDRGREAAKDGGLHYGYQRSHSLAVGRCTVQIGPDGLSWEQLVAESRARHRTMELPLAVTAVEELVRYPEEPIDLMEIDGVLVDDPREVEARSHAIRAVADLLAARLREVPSKEVFLYVHGYNNTFDFAALRMAQLWHFLGRQGVPVLYSWPAGHPGMLRGYAYDRESGDFTAFHLRQLLEGIAACPGVEKLHIVAHSRGTDILMTALREINLEYVGAGRSIRRELRLGNVILAAADLGWDVSLQRIAADRLHVLPERFTVYLSHEDKALGLVNWLLGSVRRLGDLTVGDLTRKEQRQLQEMGDFNLIDVRSESDFLGHGYFISDPAVLSDLILVLLYDRDPGVDNGRPLTPTEGGFWLLERGYPRSDPPDPPAEP
jgi:esterase/lipase superfamily enzyme